MTTSDKMSLEEIVNLVEEKTGKNRAEIQQLILAKRKRLNNLITELAAARLVASDYNITLGEKTTKATKQPETKIKDIHLAAPKNDFNVCGVISRIHEPNEFTRKDKTRGLVQNIIISDYDENGKRHDLKVVAWDKLTEVFQDGIFSRGSIIQINRGSVRQGRTGAKELHLSFNSRIINLSDKDINKEDFPDPKKDILTVDNMEATDLDADVQVIVVQRGEVTEFERKDNTKGKRSWLEIIGEKTKTRAVLWDKTERILDYDRGDKLLFEGCRIRVNRFGNNEIHIVKGTRITKLKGKGQIPESVDQGMGQITTESEELQINEILEQRNIELKARILKINEPKHFTKKDGSSGRLVRLMIFDDSGAIILLLWDNDVDLLTKLNEGDTIQVKGAYSKINSYSKKPELQLGRNKEILKIEGKDIPKYPRMREIKTIKEELLGIVSIEAIVASKADVRTFNRNDGTEGKVQWLQVKDNTESIRIVAWGEKVDELENLEKGTAVMIVGADIREQNEGKELHLIASSQIKILKSIPEKLEGIELDDELLGSEIASGSRTYERIILSEVENQERIEVRAKVTKVRDNKPFYVGCDKCPKGVKMNDEGSLECREHGIVTEPQPYMRIAILLDDGSGSIWGIMLGKTAEIGTGLKANDLYQLSKDDIEAETEVKEIARKAIEGKEMIFQGNVNKRTYEAQDGEMKEITELMINRIITPNPIIEISILKKQMEMGN